MRQFAKENARSIILDMVRCRKCENSIDTSIEHMQSRCMAGSATKTYNFVLSGLCTFVGAR